MNTKLGLPLIVIMVVSLILEAAAPAFWVVGLDVRNNTYGKVYIKLENPTTFYYLTVKPNNEDKEFTIAPKTYKATFWGCGEKKTIKKLEITSALRIVFPACNASHRSSDNKIVDKVLRVVFSHKK